MKQGFLLERDWDNVRWRPKSAEVESEQQQQQHLVTVIEQEGARK